MDTRTDARSALVALLRRPGVSWNKTAIDLLDRGESAAMDLLEEHLRETEGLLPEKTAETLAQEADQLINGWKAAGIGVYTCFDPSYPPQLRDIQEMPPVVFTRGTLEDDQRSIAVVGTRTPSPEGHRRALGAASMLADHQIPVISGLAAGVDTAAHTAALNYHSRTVAIIGTGIERYYPKENQALQDQIARQGLVLSQFWPDASPTRQSFPMRNAIMSGYAAATVVIEASQRSGTRIQARHALNHGRAVIIMKEVLSVPWAKEISEKPGVTVVGDPDEFLCAVKEVLSARFGAAAPGAW